MYHHLEGNSLATQGQCENAIASYDEAFKIKPNYLLAGFDIKVLLLFLLNSPILK